MSVEERLKKLYEKKSTTQQATDHQDEGYRQRGLAFVNDTVIPAVRSLEGPFKEHGRSVKVSSSFGRETVATAHVLIENGEVRELDCLISSKEGAPTIRTTFTDKKDGCRYSTEAVFRSGTQDYKVEAITKDEVCEMIMSEYEKLG